jgi:hypothetical protein
LAASIALGACGSSRAPEVASVAGKPITTRDLSHWIAIKRAELEASAKPESLSSADLKQRALAFLITADWLEGEAAAQGVEVSASEADATYGELLNGPTGRAFAAGLKRRGLSRADELRLLRLAALAQKLRDKLGASVQNSQGAAGRQRISAFLAAYRERWKRRTTCRPGYVIPECSDGPPLSGSQTAP